MTLSLLFDHLDVTRRGVIWKTLLQQAMDESNSQMRFSAAATTFLQTDQLRNVEWNGHEIVSCFQTATSLAMLEAKESPSYTKEREVIIDVDHFKEALNRTYAFREYMRSVEGMDPARAAKDRRLRNDWFGRYGDLSLASRYKPFGPSANPMPVPPPGRMPPLPPGWVPRPPSARMPRPLPGRMPVPPRARMLASAAGQDAMQAGQISETVYDQPAMTVGLPPQLTLDVEMDLCSPDLNRVEWQGFKDAAPAASGELFRKTKFHAIDVLVGEPCIIFKLGSTQNKRRKSMPRNGATQNRMQSDNRLTEHAVSPRPAGEAPLPERIRINSLAIGKAFQSIHDEGRFNFQSPFLVFRPFRSLLHYEQEFRDWIARQEAIVKCESTSFVREETVI